MSLLSFRMLGTSFLLVIITTFAFIQPLEERKIRYKPWKNEPVKISGLKVKNTNINFNQKFTGNEDWFRNLAVNLKNTSDKTILFIDIMLIFPATTEPTQERAASDHLLYGTYPSPTGANSNLHPDQPPLMPGDSATLSLSDYEGTRKFLDQVGKPRNIKEIEISISEVIFEDGTRWSVGQLFRQDPSSPNKWTPEQPQSSSIKQTPRPSGVTFKKSSFNPSTFNIKTFPWQDPGIFLETIAER